MPRLTKKNLIITLLVACNALCIIQYVRLSALKQRAEKIQKQNSESNHATVHYRTSILDRNSIPVASLEPAKELFFDPTVVSKEFSNDDVYKILTEHYKVSDAEASKAASKLHSNKRYIRVTINLSDDAVAKDFPGFFRGSRVNREYADKDRDASWLGFSDPYSTGHEGFELYYDSLIHRGGEMLPSVVDARRRIVKINERLPEQFQIKTSIDSNVQRISFETARDYQKKLNADSVSVLGIDPNNGEILCHVSVNKTGDLRNPFAIDSNEPGSILKSFAVLCHVESGRFDPNKEIYCPGTKSFNKRRITCHKGHGRIKANQILTYSCNVGTVELALEVPYSDFRRFFIDNTFFTKQTGIDLPYEATGYLTPMDKWSHYTQTSVPIGYEIRTTPLQIAASYSVFANGGYKVIPHFLKEIVNHKGELLYKNEIEKTKLNISKESIDAVNLMMRDVVIIGTGKLHRYKDLDYAGKTGTARIYDTKLGHYVMEYNSSFVCFAPFSKPKILLYVLVHRPRPVYYASVTAVPVASTILRRIDKEIGFFRRDVNEGKN